MSSTISTEQHAVRLTINPIFCDLFSLGTVSHILVLREVLGLGLAEAKAWIDRAVFDGEIVEIPAESREQALLLQQRLLALQGPKIQAELVSRLGMVD